MEWSWRTVMILLGLLGLAAILYDGFRRMKQTRIEALRIDRPSSLDKIEEDFNPELIGKARVIKPASPEFEQRFVGRVKPSGEANSNHPKADDQEKNHLSHSVGAADHAHGTTLADDNPLIALDKKFPSSKKDIANTAFDSDFDEPDFQDTNFKDTNFKHTNNKDTELKIPESKAADINTSESVKSHTPNKLHAPEDVIPRSPLIPKTRPVNLDEQVPLLLDVEELGDDEHFAEGIISKPRVVTTVQEEAEKASAKFSESGPSKIDNAAAVRASFADDKDDSNHEDDESLPEIEDPRSINDPHLELEVEEIPDEELDLPVNFAGPNAEKLGDRSEPELVLVIHTIAKDPDGFHGEDILFLLNSCDLRYGEKDIFHRFEEADGEGCIQFSVAQMRNPGTFDPAIMAEERFGGLSFFMSLPGAKRPLEAYEAMTEMAQAVSRNLCADVLDGSHSAMTPQTIEHERQQILDYERQKRLAAKKLRR
ncbi:MAG: cell division protein ZipA C-terminal FtsZ-binding domain-containing protein [Oleibacter sp.]|nr:cell division protein ZipA C-terminal FtsZ-binding domain-containing protein [Thalassolituus sp.]